jgi:hypothetical protein
MADDNLIKSYEQLISSYQAIDHFRAQLLERLPLATGAGIFLLYATTDTLNPDTQAFLPAIGLFGFVVTLGLFVYEIFGIMKCSALIRTGKQMEWMLGIDGQFLQRPVSIFNERFAAALIYPAVIAAWAYVGLAFVEWGNLSWIIPVLLFLVGGAGMIFHNLKLRSSSDPTVLTRLNQEILQSEENGNQNFVDQYLHPEFTIVRSDGTKLDKEQFRNAIPTNKNRGRMAAQTNVQVMVPYAIYTCIVTTTQNPDGTPNPGRFWNTRLFVKENGNWCCLSWQVMKIP